MNLLPLSGFFKEKTLADPFVVVRATDDGKVRTVNFSGKRTQANTVKVDDGAAFLRNGLSAGDSVRAFYGNTTFSKSGWYHCTVMGVYATKAETINKEKAESVES